MKNTSLTPLCLVAAIGLGIWGGWEHQRRMKLEDELKAVTMERNTLSETARKKIALSAKTEVKPGGPEGLGPEHADDLKAEQEAQKKKEAPSPANPMREGLAKMMQDPATKEAMKAQMRGQVDYLYRDLLDMLNLPAEKRDTVNKVLLDRTAAAAELGMKMMSGQKLTPEEQKAQSESLKKAMEDSDTALKDVLGEDYAKFDKFEKSQPERMQLTSITGQMKDAGVELSPEAESQLMDAMYEERTSFKFDNDMGNQRNFDMSRLTAENLQRYQEQSVILQGKIYDRAAKILSPEQLPVFRKSQESQAALQKMQLEMAAKMFQQPAPGAK